MNNEYLWIRLGDASDYEKEDSVEDLAESLAGECGIIKRLIRYGRYGITDNDKFKGLNYISLFYGDDDAQPTRPVSNEELTELNKRIKAWHEN